MPNVKVLESGRSQTSSVASPGRSSPVLKVPIIKEEADLKDIPQSATRRRAMSTIHGLGLAFSQQISRESSMEKKEREGSQTSRNSLKPSLKKSPGSLLSPLMDSAKKRKVSMAVNKTMNSLSDAISHRVQSRNAEILDECSEQRSHLEASFKKREL